MRDHTTKFEQFELLLAQKHFDDLSEKEKAIVVKYCDSAQEYGLMRKMILAQAPAIAPAENIPQNLLDKVAKNAKPAGPQLMSIAVPLWGYLLSLFAVFGLTYFLRPNTVEIKETIKEVSKEIIKEVPKEIIKMDTVVQYAYRVDTVYLKSEKSSNTSTKTGSAKAALVTQEVLTNQSIKKTNQHPKGRTIKQDRDLKAFFTDIQ